MSLVSTVRAPIIGSAGRQSITDEIISELQVAGATVLSRKCINNLVAQNTDAGITDKTFEIKDELSTAGATIISMSCTYQLVTQNFE